MLTKTQWWIVGGISALALGIITIYLVKSQKKNGVISNDNKPKKSLDPKVEDAQLSKDFNFFLIPDGLNNYRSAQILKKDLANVIKKYGIKHIIRMNGDDGDSKHKSKYEETTKATEKKICEDNDCEWTFINAHEGYVKGKGYQGSLNKMDTILKQGNTLIHCTHGQDRTGGMVGGYLKRNKHITDLDTLWKYTTEKNGWQQKLTKCGLSEAKGCFFGSGYDKYADTFYPLDLLRKSKWVKK